MMPYIGLAAILILSATLLSGCDNDEPVSSDSVSNNELQAAITVTKASVSSAILVVQLRAVNQTSNNFVELNGDDRLLASIESPVEEILQQSRSGLFGNAVFAGDHLSEMTHRELINNQPEYFAIFDDINDGSAFYVSMLRSVDTTILSSQVLLPPSFTLQSPATGDRFGRSENIPIMWDNTYGYAMELFIEGDCGNNDRVSTSIDIGSDSGSYVLSSGSFSAQIDNPSTANCTLSLNLRRKRNGSLNSDFGMGGTIVGVQQRTINITSTP